MTPTATERPTAAPAADLELAGLVLATLPRLKLVIGLHEQGALSPGRAGVLLSLRESAFRSGELAQRSGMTPSALTELVDSLARDGFVRRTEDPGDRRVVLVELTGRGRREIDRHFEVAKERVARLLAGLTVEKRARLRSALTDLHEALEAAMGEAGHAR